ncbi:hypothetical protein JMF97_18150 [Micromonospora fiedleri]|uniref:LPXTG-motif cell wall anchor domain-containing protein n=1 Tax=Micromonospora fiedleri TaxID=1157498 RepID=A0ABS1UP22_9ACTN|nr:MULTISPECIES: hypothetical protein [Micromonospora]MBL6278083.1 hypothetical protein [Micromonospora fiedleri]WSK41188.1 hypothetical protein OG712_22095 [Micromonospora maris]
MRLSRIIMALTVGLAVVAVPAVAAAQPQPAPSPTVTDPPQPPPYPPNLVTTLTVNRPTIFLGETVVITGRNFGPNETVDIVVTAQPLAAPAAGTARRSDGSTVAMAPVAFQAAAAVDRFTARTNAAGVFTRRYTPRVTGLLTITATGRESDRTASTELRVLHKKKPHLPVTGSSLGTPMKVGGGLVAVGGVMLLGTMLWRRRNRFGTGGAR